MAHPGLAQAADAPPFSVIIPTHNRAALLRRAVQSALGQGLEVIVVDDASSDETPAVLRELEHPRLSWRRLDENRGPGRARNVAAQLVSTDFVLYLDDDDFLLEGAVDVVRDVIERFPDYDVWFHNCRQRSGRTSIPSQVGPRPYTYEEWLDGIYSGELKPVARVDFLQRYEFPETGASGEGLLWGRVLRSQRVLVSGTPIIMYDDSAGVDRLTTAAGLLKRAPANAAISEELLMEFGADLRARNERRWASRVLAAMTYNLMSGRRERARDLLAQLPRGATPGRLVLRAVTYLPLPVVRLLYLLWRRELRATIRQGALRRTLL